MRNKKDTMTETIFIEIVAWAFILGIVYLIAKAMF
jgi:hypothetical protein